MQQNNFLTCARCGEEKELCQSVTSNGIKQPRICKDCLIISLRTGDESISEMFWIKQLSEQKEFSSLKKLVEQIK